MWLIWGGLADAVEPGALAIADHHADRGRWRLAMVAYRELSAEHPEDPRVRLGIARVQAGLGRCDQALPVLARMRATAAWDADAAWAEGLCHLRTGALGEAEVALRESVALGAGDEVALQLALVHGALDEGGLERRLEDLEDGPAHAGSLAVRAQQALEHGQVQAFERWLRLGLDAAEEHVGLRILDARRWLDLGDPVHAVEALQMDERRAHLHPQAVLWRTEALRRQGDLQSARTALTSRTLRDRLQTPLALAFQARLAVDEGDLERAGALVAAAPDPYDEQALASAWYLARARGEAEEAQVLARRWRQQVRAADRSLEQLSPVRPQEVP